MPSLGKILVSNDECIEVASADCWNIFSALNQELLDKVKKGHTLEQCEQAIRWTHEAGIESRGALMIGLPGETPAMAEKTTQHQKRTFWINNDTMALL